jgi:branched-chain amino acid transport system substrate-binding protein
VIDLGLKEGYKTAAIVHEDTLFPVSTANGTEAYAKEKGVQVVLKEKYPAKVTDVSSVLTKVRGLNPDMLLGGSYLPDSLLIVRQAKELDVNPKLVALSVGAAIPDFVQSLQKDANYVFGPSMWEPEIKTPGNEEFVKAYMAKWNREPDYHAASGWAGCQVLEAAVKKVGALDREKLRDALQALEMETIMPGKYKVDEKGMMVGHIPLVIQWQNEKKVIVYPGDMATGKHVLPTPPWKSR